MKTRATLFVCGLIAWAVIAAYYFQSDKKIPAPSIYYGGRARFANFTINHHAVSALLDTGSDGFYITNYTADKLGLHTTPVPPVIPIIAALSEPTAGEFGQARFDKLQLPVLHEYMAKPYSRLLVPWTAIKDNILVFDSRYQTITAVEQLPEYTAGWLKCKISPAATLYLNIPLPDGQTGVVAVDTGYTGGVSLPQAAWDKLLAQHPATRLSPAIYEGEELASGSTDEGWFDTVSLGPLTLTNVPVAKDLPTIFAKPPGYIGCIGLNAIRRLDLVLDGRTGFAYLRPKSSGDGHDEPTGPAAARNWKVADNVRLNLAPLLIDAAVFKITLQEYADAIADCTQALATDPDNLEALQSRALAENHLGDYPAAVADYSHALAFDPANFYILAERGMAEVHLGKWPETVADLTQAIDHLPHASNLSDFHAFRGMARQALGDFPAAVADYDQAIALQPDRVRMTYLYRYFLQKQLGQKPADFSPALKKWTNPWQIAAGQFVLGQLDEKSLLAAAENSDPKLADAQRCEADYLLGLSHLLNADQNGARDFWQKAATADEKNLAGLLARAELARARPP